MPNCPRCDTPMEHVDDEPDTNIPGGWACPKCEGFIHDGEFDDGED